MKAKLFYLAMVLAMGFALVLSLIPLMAAPVTAGMVMPHAFYGTVKISGADAPVNTVVSAKVNVSGVDCGSYTTKVAGKYGSRAESDYLVVQGDIHEGEPIDFYVNGVKANETASFIPFGGPTELNLTVAATPPTVTTNTATGVTTTQATLNGYLNALGTNLSVNVSFEWGTDTSYGNTTTAETLTSAGTFDADISGLSPGTEYHFRAVAVGDGTTNGSDKSFTTLTTPPSVSTNEATAVADKSATLHGNLTALGTNLSVSVSFEWGTSTSYGNTTTAETLTSAGTFSAALTGLAPVTTYHFRAKAVGDGTSVGLDKSFTTSTTPPSVTTNEASAITNTSATLNGNLTALGTASSVDVSFEWGTNTSYGNTTTAETLTSAGTFSADLSGLSLGITYHFRAKAVGDGTSYGSDKSFTTGTKPSVTTDNATGVTTDSATLNGNLTALGTASSVNVSFQWGTSTSYGNTTTAETLNSTGTFNAALTSLAPGTTYHFRAVAEGHGTSYGSDKSFTTSAAAATPTPTPTPTPTVTPTPTATPTPTPTPTATPAAGLGAGTWAGIGIGIIFGAIALGLAIWLMIRRRRPPVPPPSLGGPRPAEGPGNLGEEDEREP